MGRNDRGWNDKGDAAAWLNRLLLIGDTSSSGISCKYSNIYIKEMSQEVNPDYTYIENYSGGFPNTINTGISQGVAPFLRDIKANSSRWASQSHSPKFQWQDGYGSFSVGVSSLDQVKGYIRNQAEHHQKRDFSAEYDALLRACGIVPLGEMG